jgi:hypothetical protein
MDSWVRGTKGEKLNFYSSNIQNSPLVPVLKPKSTTFSHLVSVQKKSKKYFFVYLYLAKYLIFGPKSFLAAFGTWYYNQKTFKKLKQYQVPNTGLFRYFKLSFTRYYPYTSCNFHSIHEKDFNSILLLFESTSKIRMAT